MGVHLERLHESDWQRLIKLMIAARGPQAANSYAEWSARLKLSEQSREVWVATDGSVDVGIVNSADYGTAIVVHTLFVKKSHRGHGIGSDLLRRAEKWAEERGRLMLKTSVDREIENPEEVVAWLQSKGFEKTSSDANFIDLRKQAVEAYKKEIFRLLGRP